MPYESILCSIFAYRYRTSGHSASQSRIGTFFLLLDLMQFFDLYHAGQHDTALDVSFVFEQIFAGVSVHLLLLEICYRTNKQQAKAINILHRLCTIRNLFQVSALYPLFSYFSVICSPETNWLFLDPSIFFLSENWKFSKSSWRGITQWINGNDFYLLQPYNWLLFLIFWLRVTLKRTDWYQW